MQYIRIGIQLSIWQSQASFCLSADSWYAWYIENRTWILKTSLHLRYFIFCFLIYLILTLGKSSNITQYVSKFCYLLFSARKVKLDRCNEHGNCHTTVLQSHGWEFWYTWQNILPHCLLCLKVCPTKVFELKFFNKKNEINWLIGKNHIYL
jgi:hypothetical protein